MKFGYFLSFLILFSFSVGHASQFAVKCAGNTPNSQVTVVGMIKQGNFWNRYKFVGAFQVDNNNPTILVAKNLLPNQYGLILSDQSFQNAFDLTLPYVLGNFPSGDSDFVATATVSRLAGINNPIINGDKLSCIGTVARKPHDGFKGIFGDVTEAMGNLIAGVLLPQLGN